MTANIGSLAVSLSLDASNFNGSMAQVDRNLKAMGSELKAIKSKGTDYGKSLEGLNSKQDVLKRSLEASNIKLSETRKKYDEMKESGSANEVQLERQAKKVNDAQAAYNKLEAELKEVEAEIKKQSSSWYQLSEKLAPVGTKLKTVGDGMKSFGKDLTMKVTAPIVAMGGAAFKTAVDFESAFAGVRKTVDASESEFAKLEKGIRDMSKQLPTAATDIAAVAESAGQLGIKNEAILGFTRTIIDLGEATNLTREQAATEFARFANIVGMSQKDFDRLGSSIVGLGNTMATTESEIMSMGMRLAAQGAQVGMSEAQIMALAATMSSLGIEAEAGGTAMTTVLKKIQGAVGEGGKELEFFAKAAGVSSAEFKKAWENDAVTALDILVKGLSNSANEGENLTTILDTLGIKGIREADTMLRLAGASDLLSSAVKTSSSAWEENTALSNEAEQRYKTTASQIKILWNEIKDLGITIGGELIPIVKDGIDTVKPWIKSFAEMDKSTQKTILAIGGVVAAIGPLLVVGGALMSGLGGLITTVSAVSGAIAAAGGATAILSGALTVLTGPIGITVGAIAALTYGGIKLYKHLQKSSIEVDLWGEGVSEATKKAVSGYLELDKKATLSLNQLSWGQQRITKEMADTLIGTFDEMNTQIVENMNKKHEEQLSSVENLMSNSISITKKEKDEILKTVQESQKKEADAVEFGRQTINGIITQAAEENRQITESEQRVIDSIRESMKKTAVKVMSESQAEQKAILESMKMESGKITAEQAAETVKNSVEQKNKVVKEAEEQYQKAVAEIIRLRDETGAITQEQAEKMIRDAQEQRDGVVESAKSMHNDVVKQAKLQADEHVNYVNWETGEVLTKWQKLHRDVSVTAELMKGTIKQKSEEMYANFRTKTAEMVTNGVSKFIELKNGISDRIDEAKKKVTDTIDEIKRFFARLVLKIPKIELPKLPKITLEMGSKTILGKEISYPTGFDVKWNAKGVLFTRPTIFNTPLGLQGFGEAGPEAALPLTDRVLGTIGKMIAETMAGNNLRNGDTNVNIYPQKAIIDETEIMRTIQRLEVLYG